VPNHYKLEQPVFQSLLETTEVFFSYKSLKSELILMNLGICEG